MGAAGSLGTASLSGGAAIADHRKLAGHVLGLVVNNHVADDPQELTRVGILVEVEVDRAAVIQTCRRSLHTYIHAYIHTYIHTYM